ncbi:FadR/GntR family transcriptional regulator [Martelella radicis]
MMSEETKDQGRAGSTTKRIYEFIRSEDLTLGDSLPSEMELAKRLEVGRGAVREALRALEALHVIDSGNGRRARVAGIDPNALAILIDHAIRTGQVTTQQVLDVRRSIEMRAIHLAAIRRSEEEAQQIVRLAAEMMDNLPDRQILSRLDVAFHRAIGLASRNPMYDLFIGSFSAVMNESGPIGWQTRPSDEELVAIIKQHTVIAEAVRDTDPTAAEAAMSDHFDMTVRALINSGYQ